MARLIIRRQQQQAQYLTEELGDGVGLEMMLIPSGSFLMGSPENELDSYERERPQHKVNVSTFFIGRYPITQEQWRVVAGWKQVDRELNPDPSRFKDNYNEIERWLRPVENVSWNDAKEFCARLSKKTKTNKEYRLPTEAEWEYACRAGTTTPFHFGETINNELANYRGTDWEYEGKVYPGNYGRGLKGIYREQTTPVKYFKVANNFGLGDMHGNVWEWCEDNWHDNYQDAPNDGSAWLSGTRSNKVIRGGSWLTLPDYCRSAFRYFNTWDFRDYSFGFRVVCSEASLPLRLENLVKNEYELMQLYRLYEGETQPRPLVFKKRKSFLAELRHLRTLGLIANKPDKTIGSMPQRGEDLRDYVNLTQKGLSYIKDREMYGLPNPRKNINPEFWK